MKKNMFNIIVISLCMLFYAFTVNVTAQPTEEQLKAFRSAKTVIMIVNQSYKVEDGDEIKDVSLPFEEVAKRILQYAGLKVAGNNAKYYDVTLRIQSKGEAKSIHYTIGTRYSAASLSGIILFESAGIQAYKKSFKGYISPPFIIGEDKYKNPSSAPFNEVFWISGSFVSKTLIMIGEVYGVNALIGALKDQEYDLRYRAIEALGEIKDNRAVEPLIAVRKDKNSSVRKDVAEALEKLGWSPEDVKQRVIYLIDKGKWNECVNIGKPAVEPLIAALKDKDSDVRKKAAEALGKIKDSRAGEALLATFKDEITDVRQYAAEALGKIGYSRAVEPLIAVLKDKNEFDSVREEAAEALGELKDNRAVEPLIAALKDKDRYTHKYIRKKAAEALGKIKDSRAVEPLIAALKDEDSGVRSRAAKALGEIKDNRAVEPLIATLKDKSKDVRKEAAQALGKIKDSRAVEPLNASLKDEIAKVWVTAAWAIWEINKDNHAFEIMIDSFKKDRYETESALVEIGKPAIKSLIAALHYKLSSDVRKKAAILLGRIKDSQAIDPLIVVLKDEDEDTSVRIKVTEALGNIKDSQAVEPLITALMDEETGVRQYAAVALGKIGDSRAVEPLITALKDENSLVRRYAAVALRRITGQNFGEDYDAWSKWWQENKHEY